MIAHRVFSARPFVLIASLFLAVTFASSAEAGSAESQIPKFRKAVAADYQNPQAYEDLVAALEADGLVGGGKLNAFMKVVDRALDPKGLQGRLINLDGMEAHHRLGLVLYGRGYEEESMYVLDKYKNTRKYTPKQALKKAKKLYKDATGEEPPA